MTLTMCKYCLDDLQRSDQKTEVVTDFVEGGWIECGDCYNLNKNTEKEI
jgi:hypothetical protein